MSQGAYLEYGWRCQTDQHHLLFIFSVAITICYARFPRSTRVVVLHRCVRGYVSIGSGASIGVAFCGSNHGSHPRHTHADVSM